MEKFTTALNERFGIEEVAKFQSSASYYNCMDYIEYMNKDVPCVSDRIDDLLTVFKDENNSIVGFRVKGFRYFFVSQLQEKYQLTNQDFVELVDVVSSILTLQAKEIIQDNKRSEAYKKVYDLVKDTQASVHDFHWKSQKVA